ncbi:MAG TPA: AarF/ABC1/UbiB kinase family protein [Verrucomicrobiae bacterium]|nr:AarF/ABC1/UbiB kinase family protein [Verrucomicrobiae bacterium]
MPSLVELMRALPEENDGISGAAGRAEPLAAASLRPVPVGRVRRLGLLGSLQAKIGAAYLFYWIRGWFRAADEKQRLLAETHWRTAVRLLDSMGYLRGAIMKIGQTLANLPQIVPDELVETLDQLHYTAPPMHWSLLREMVQNELGDDPQNIFASFERRAFAAASLGQVHQARLRSGEDVVVKVQYPGIARTIGEDFRNLALFLFPGRLTKDWENTKAQMEDLRIHLEAEADYEAEAATLIKARPLFREEDGILVPRVYTEFSTTRILTMERIGGVHLDQFLQRNPSQEQRNEAARKLVRGWYRLFFAGRLLYADYHPGNFLVLADGRLGMLDFGFMLPLDEELWTLMRKMDRGLTTGRREDIAAVVKEWSWITNAPADAERLRLTVEYTEWSWRARFLGGEFDFGDEADFLKGASLFGQMVGKRYSRARPCTPIISRQQFGLRALLYRLRARIDVRTICEEELAVTGWDRSEYA